MRDGTGGRGPTYRTVRGILAAGTETALRPTEGIDPGAASVGTPAHLHGADGLLAHLHDGDGATGDGKDPQAVGVAVGQ